MSNFFNELKNRNVYKAATAYVVTGWLIMQVVDTMSNNLEWPPVIASWITKILIVGFPIALVITWLYEVTPSGLKRTGKVQEDTPENRRSGKRLNHLIIGALAITICFMLVERVFFAGNVSINKRQEASIAVLPFENLSQDEEYAFLANSLPAQLIEELALVSGLQVTNRTSSFAVKKQGADAKNIGETLDVNYLLDGDLQYDKRSNRIRISTHLINAGNGYVMWAETFEDDFDKIQQIQENVNRKVASRLRVQLLPEEDKALSRKITENSEAYKLYMEAREYGHKRTEPDLKKAIELANQALTLEPEFAEAHAAISTFYGLRAGYGNFSPKERDRLQEIHLKKATEIAPDLPEVLQAKAARKLWILNDTTEVIKDMKHAIAQKPGFVEAHYALFNAYLMTGQPDLARKTIENILRLDPANNFYNSQLAQRMFHFYKEPEKAIAIIDRQLLINPDAPNANRLALFKANFLTFEPYGNLVEGFKIRHQEYKKDPTEKWNLNHGLMGALDLDLLPWAEELGNKIQLRFSNTWSIYNNMGTIYAFKRDYRPLKELIEFSVQQQWIDEKEGAIEQSWINLMSGDTAKAMLIFETTLPDFADESILSRKFPRSEQENWIQYVELLRMTKQDEKADRFAEKFCEYTQSVLEDPISSYHYRNWLKLNCHYLSNNKKDFIQTLDTIFFKKKDRHDWFIDIKSGLYQMFEDDPEFKSLFRRIEAETHRMRAEVIEYLKEEGDWDPAWNKELGLE